MATSPTTEPEATPGWDRFVVLGLVATVLVGLFLWTLAAAPALLSQIWSDDLSELPEDVASSRVGMLAQLGDAGLPSLVDALGNPRESVAAAARDVLRDELARWRLMPAEESTPKIAKLIECLNERVGRWRPEQRRVAAEIAQAALAWQCAGEAVDRTLLVERCDAILRAATTGQERFAAHAVVGDEGAENPRLAWDDRHQTAGEQVRGVAYEELASLPGGDLPFDIAQIPALASPAFTPHADVPPALTPANSANEPPRLVPPAAARPLLPASQPGAGEFNNAAIPPAINVPPELGESRPNAPLRVRQRVVPEEIGLMRQLLSTDPQVAEQARKELQSRGFDAVALDVAARLVDPDPAIRRTLCNDLPRIPRFDARAWLLWLADDSDATVRAAARGILATSPDAELVRRLDAGELDVPSPRQ